MSKIVVMAINLTVLAINASGNYLYLVSIAIAFLAFYLIAHYRSTEAVEYYLPEIIVAKTVKNAIITSWQNDQNSVMAQLDRKYS